MTAKGSGYAAISSDGQVYAYGKVKYRDNPTGFTGEIVGISVTADGKGYAAISSAGQVYAYGKVKYRDNPTGFTGSIVGISVTANGRGYAAVSSDGQVYAFGNVKYWDNPTGFTESITGISVNKGGKGYAVVSSTGQVYAYGKVKYQDNPTGFTGDISAISVTGNGKGYLAMSSIGQVYASGEVGYYGNGDPGSGDSSAAEAANSILGTASIELATVHSSGVVDEANAHQNVVDTANGLEAQRSSYDNAPGGTINLRVTMLNALLDIGGTWDVRVSEIAGGSHSVGSQHYEGLAFDIDLINGAPVNGTNSDDLVNRCNSLGASYAAYENGNHVHCNWPPDVP